MLSRSKTWKNISNTPWITLGRLNRAHPIIMQKIIWVREEVKQLSDLPRSLQVFNGKQVTGEHKITCSDIAQIKTKISDEKMRAIGWLQTYYKQLNTFQNTAKNYASANEVRAELEKPYYTHLEHLDTWVLNMFIKRFPSLNAIISLLEIPAFHWVKFNTFTFTELLKKVHNVTHLETLFEIPQIHDFEFTPESVNELFKMAKSVEHLDVMIRLLNPKKRKNSYNAQTVCQIVEVIFNDKNIPIEDKEHRIIDTFKIVDTTTYFTGTDRGVIIKKLYGILAATHVKWEEWFFREIAKTSLGKVINQQIVQS